MKVLDRKFTFSSRQTGSRGRLAFRRQKQGEGCLWDGEKSADCRRARKQDAGPSDEEKTFYWHGARNSREANGAAGARERRDNGKRRERKW
jgi:hypothetical protein